ncbi:hypothetical protein WA171_003529 [Blastocystis sp. BT1]
MLGVDQQPQRHSRKRSYSSRIEVPEDVYNKMPCIDNSNPVHYEQLHIVSDASDDFSAYETVIQPTAHRLTGEAGSSNQKPSWSVYHNPFREHDISSFPLDLRQRLAQFPIVTQIAILKSPELQLRYFPEYCYPKNGSENIQK